MQRSPVLENFGRNIQIHPEQAYAPRDEQEVLQILRRHRGQRIRAVGRLHSWSAAPVAEQVLLDLRRLQHVRVGIRSEGQARADVGAGCQIKRLISQLQAQGNYALPSQGLITEQTIAGATATGTHGSGRHSLAHYVQEMRLACYDPDSGDAVVRVVQSGPELEAARCALGVLGIVTQVTLPLRSQYLVEEHFRRYARLDDVLAAEEEFDLQQFFLVPWRWDYFVQHRREVSGPRSRLAPLYRLYWTAGMDVGLHVAVGWLARRLPRSCTPPFYRRVAPLLIPQNWRVADRSDRQLTMEHELFRHIEIETFVRRSQMASAVEYVIQLLGHLGGAGSQEFSPTVRQELISSGHWDTMGPLEGVYSHHYPICIRKVLPDDTLISMASGGPEPWYAISFISYAHPQRRAGFFQFAEILARTMAALFDARPHWGKVCPLHRSELKALYPKYEEFRRLRAAADPDGRFLNDWTASLFA